MLKNLFVVTVRNIRKNPIFSFINILGLTLGISTFLFFDQYANFESSYDDFHHKSESIYRISTLRYANGELFHKNIGAMPPLKPLLLDQLDGLEDLALLYNDGSFIVENPQSKSPTVFEEERAYYSDKNFFKIFGFGIKEGNPETALNGVKRVVISASTAIKYFGNESPIGQTLQATGQSEVIYEVTAVYNDPPANSHFKPEMIFSFSTYLEVVHPDWGVSANWVWNDFPIYIRISDNVDPVSVEKRINEIAQSTWKEIYEKRNVNFDFVLQPIQSIHTNSDRFNEFEANNNERTLSWMQIIAILTLIVALINFINLSTARSLERAKEVGVRKVIGANRGQLFFQFLIESLVINLTATAIALLLIATLNNSISTWLNLNFHFVYGTQIIIPIATILLCGLLSGIYPSLVLSSFKPAMVLKGKFRSSKNGVYIRTALVYLQFIITPLLIGGTLLIYKQTNLLINREIGVNVDQILVLNAPKINDGNMTVKQEYFKQQMESSSHVNNVSSMMLLPGENIGWESSFKLYGDSTDHQMMVINLVEYEFENVFDLNLVAGRAFSNNYADSTSLIINESAARLWGYEPNEIIGKSFWWRYSPTIHHFDKKVIGVVNDYKQLAYSNEDKPMIYSLRRYTPASFSSNNIVLRLNINGDNAAQIMTSEINKARNLWAGLYPNDPFIYSFLDDEFNQRFLSETKFSSIVNLFSILSVFIAAMGLFGLSSFSIIQRTKELGIRKVLGASVSNISTMIISQYLKLIVIAYVIAVPLLYLGAVNWLNNYEIRIELDLLFFIIPMILSLFIGLISIIQQTTKASLQNPVKSMRQE